MKLVKTYTFKATFYYDYLIHASCLWVFMKPNNIIITPLRKVEYKYNIFLLSPVIKMKSIQIWHANPSINPSACPSVYSIYVSHEKNRNYCNALYINFFLF